MRLIGNVEKDAQVRAVASGALPSGDTVIVNADGTVSVVAETVILPSAGSPTIFENGNAGWVSAAYDANAQKVVVAYTDYDNSTYGTAVVGSVSGESISFGSPVVFASAASILTSSTYDAAAQKVVIAYKDEGNSNYGTAIVGTVSGTSISFGSEAVFASVNSSEISCAYDASAQRVVVAYRDGTNGYGKAVIGTVSGTSISFGSPVTFESSSTTVPKPVYDVGAQKMVIAYTHNAGSLYGKAIVGTVSGTSISFGSSTTFESASTDWVSSTYDANSQKVVIAYQDTSNSNYGTAVVGTVSGTSISFGTPVVFESASTYNTSCAYDSNSQNVTIAYRDGGNSSYGTAIVGTVSGTSIGFSSPVVFESAYSSYFSCTYDDSSQRVVIPYRDNGNSSYGTAVVFQNGGTSINLTSENFLGFAAHTYADTQSALVNSTCTVDRNQTSLTAGQTYYVQTDGSLGTTAADPSVVAGTAISSTEIIVKG